MNILLLGGTGAMGVYLSKILSACADIHVTVTSRNHHLSKRKNLTYLCGNAREGTFLESILSSHYDVIVDFMNYGYDEFNARYQTLLASTAQYVFLSSARVYAQSSQPLTEESPRLLETTTDMDFLSTQRYALRKAREENLLLKSGVRNFTIIRPYKTFSEERLQLGAYEKEQWLQRALQGKVIPIRQDLLVRRTTLTFAQDVAAVIAQLIGCSKAFGEIVQIATSESLQWIEVVEVYRQILLDMRGVDLHLMAYEHNAMLESLFEGGYQFRYDVFWDRTFKSDKVQQMIGKPIVYTPVKEGLSHCLRTFLSENHGFLEASTEFSRLADEMEEGNA